MTADKRVMTREYAALSLRAGLLAGALDLHLGGVFFGKTIREFAWSLSEDFLTEIKRSAIEMGVPAEVIAAAEEDATAMLNDKVIGSLLALQRKVDDQP